MTTAESEAPSRREAVVEEVTDRSARHWDPALTVAEWWDGDQWRVTGQKVWSSGRHQADCGMLLARTNPDAPLTVFSPAPSIYGGTDQVQRNILGERGLGLPKEPGPHRDTPFRELIANPHPHAVGSSDPDHRSAD